MITFPAERSAAAPLRASGPACDHGSPGQAGGWRSSWGWLS